jgi:hypothetical protein
LSIAEIAVADAGTIEKLIRRYPALIRFNRRRSAAQTYDCSGLISAHITLPLSVARQIANVVSDTE